MQLLKRFSSVQEYAPHDGPGETTFLELFARVVGYHDHMKSLPRWVIWSVDGLLGISFVLALWGFIMGLVRCWSNGQW